MKIPPEYKEIITMMLLFFLTFVGAFTLYICSCNRGVRPFSVFHAFNKKINTNTKPSVVIYDAIVTSILGAIIGYFATQPVTYLQALAAGLGFVGVINTIGGKNE